MHRRSAIHSSVRVVSRRRRAAMRTFRGSPLRRPCRRQILLAGGNPFAKMPASRWGHDGHTRYRASGWSTAYTPAMQPLFAPASISTAGTTRPNRSEPSSVRRDGVSPAGIVERSGKGPDAGLFPYLAVSQVFKPKPHFITRLPITGPAPAAPYPHLDPLYTPCSQPPVSPLYCNSRGYTGGLQGV